MSARRAPDGGYAFAAKDEYRNAVWSAFRADPRVLPSQAHALLMPSIEGHEIETAIRHGFREANLHVVDMNPAIVATLKRRFPKVNTYGVTASRACERIAASGVRLDVANFDFTSCVSGALLDEIGAIRRSGCFVNRAAVCITVLRGREPERIRSLLGGLATGVESDAARVARECNVSSREFGVWDYWRMTLATYRLCDFFRWRRAGIYLSPLAGQTMLWWVSRITPQQFITLPTKTDHDGSKINGMRRAAKLGHLNKLRGALRRIVVSESDRAAMSDAVMRLLRLTDESPEMRRIVSEFFPVSPSERDRLADATTRISQALQRPIA